MKNKAAMVLGLIMMAGCLYGCGTAGNTAANTVADNKLAAQTEISETETNDNKPAAQTETTENETNDNKLAATTCMGVVSKDEEFGGTYLGIDATSMGTAGFAYGDSCDLVFENGYEIDDIPYYSGYFGKTNDPAIVDYQGYPFLCFALCSGDSSWEKAGCKDGDTVTVVLREQGKYLAVEEAMSMLYSDEESDFADDATFGNFRVMKGGSLPADTFYRGASPVNNCHNRAPYVDALLEKNNIAFVLDLADNEEKFTGYQAEDGFASQYDTELFREGKVALLGLNAAYRTEDYARKLAGGLKELSAAEGPYYIHCTEGKDRTGFVCILIEAIGGCSYDEIRDDYMYTYDNYFGITEESDPKAFAAIDEMRFQDMMFYLTGTEDEAEAKKADLVQCAKQYLLLGGMTDQEFSALSECCMMHS